MFYRNNLKTKKTGVKWYKYDLLNEVQNSGKDDGVLKYNQPKISYNLITKDGSLKAGYGFKQLAMPTSLASLDDESVIRTQGDEVLGLWKFKWYDSQTTHTDKYYLFYFNENNQICYDNVLDLRYLTLLVPNTFTEMPVATYYRKDGEDALLLAGNGSDLMIVTGAGITTSANAPKIISCCTHYGKLFAITREKRGTLVYTDNTNVATWSSDGTDDLDFGDGRGNLNKILSFDDYLYIFRDFGITKISIYGSDEFSISHMYFSDSYIYPNSIAQSGDRVYFLTRSGLKVFNGSSVKDIKIDCMDIINSCDNANCYATCFNGKYYLACRGDFKDNQTVGCEGYNSGYINNMLFVYDLISEHVEILRGADIHQVLALTNPYKSKLVACFYNEHIGKIGELTTDGKLFDSALSGVVTFAKSDLGRCGKTKRIRTIYIKSAENCSVTVKNEDKSFQFSVSGSTKIQRIKTNIVGKSFTVEINSQNSNASISKLMLEVEEEE